VLCVLEIGGRDGNGMKTLFLFFSSKNSLFLSLRKQNQSSIVSLDLNGKWSHFISKVFQEKFRSFHYGKVGRIAFIHLLLLALAYYSFKLDQLR